MTFVPYHSDQRTNGLSPPIEGLGREERTRIGGEGTKAGFAVQIKTVAHPHFN